MRNPENQYATGRTTKHPEVLLFAMLMTILIITGFQAYWIRDNYKREKGAAEVKAWSLFRETVRDVQDSILQTKLQLVLKDSLSSLGFKKRLIEGKIKRRLPGLPGAARVVNLLKEKMLKDSLDKLKGAKTNIVISLHDNPHFRGDSVERLRFGFDSAHRHRINEMLVVSEDRELTEKRLDSLKWKETFAGSVKGDHEKSFSKINTVFFNNEKGERFSIKIDSLFKDPVSIAELTTIFSKTLKAQKLDIPFTVHHEPMDIANEEDFIRRPFQPDSFAGYKLQIGNAFSYLIKKISLPILFSLFLVGLTIVSFILLYRNLLRQHRLAQLKNDLISNITHELKTPIATVNVAIEALKNFNALQDPQKTKEYLDISQNELQRLGLLVDKVLKLSMFENKEIELKYEVFDLEEVVKEVVASLRLQIEKFNGRISIHSEGNLLIRADKTHLLSVVFNLLDNALKYSKGNASIQVDIKEENENIVLKVTDNGIGIPQEYKDKVFEKFFRVPTGDTHNAKGHGLGLSYTAQVVRQHKGNIEVESHEGIGSTFMIILPKSINQE